MESFYFYLDRALQPGFLIILGFVVLVILLPCILKRFFGFEGPGGGRGMPFDGMP